ncbi:MAG TPA: tRNA pseudouridine(55) synthase TruB [Candidatus Marinimicrobia bacterium]|nr:tRNA pseudouridine(55) synthase TruB [Candidatus Neomarinimicrobiota bacterium]HRS51552.1 tRNA pseudouridine(55) synthase TruB [Candidatus Neomarinimicrobiota bacterium]HRU92930.1 tRNA pseudouridine(55) synthase TruB [Candidatus Neomarinimicrobiota bacterium]
MIPKTDWSDKILNVYKPVGISSYDVVRRVKHILKIKKVGHSGTLDPFGEGVLLILIGGATKKMNELLKLPKSYEAILRLGEATATGDNTAPIIKTVPVPLLTADKLLEIAKNFTGIIEQIPPIYSAKKINGCPAYKYARKGQKVELQPTQVNIYELDLSLLDSNTIFIKVSCSSGTYIRKLGEDIAQALGTVGHLTSLKRTRIGNYDWKEAVPFSELNEYLLENAAA